MGIDFSKLYDDESLCAHAGCRVKNTEFAFYTYDWASVKYWCDKHWGTVCMLFKLVMSECVTCERNHPADFWDEELTIATIKFQDKYWDLCDYHYELYHNLIGK